MHNPEDFPVSLEHRIDWSELDLFGHVNNVEFFKYLQSGRVNYWMKMGLFVDHEKTGTGPLLATAKCDFRLPLFFPGSIQICTRLAFMRNKSFGFHHYIFDPKGKVSAVGEDVVVMFDFRKNESIPIPENYRQAAEKIEGKEFPVSN